MSDGGFDSLCDPSAPGTLVDDAAIWAAVMAAATASKSFAPAAVEIADDVECPVCCGGGWECYGLGRGGPHFKECEKCGNPKGLKSP